MYRTISLSIRTLLAPFAIVALAACGGIEENGGGEGEGEGEDFFEDLFEDGGLLDAGEEGDDAGEEGDDAGGGPSLPYIVDAVNTESGGNPAVFSGASGRWRSDISGTMIGGVRVLEQGAESIAVRVDGSEARAYDCGADALISYNARDSAGSPLLYSTRPEGASCSVVIDAYDEVGGRIRGYFDVTFIDGAGGSLDMNGSFDVERLADQ